MANTSPSHREKRSQKRKDRQERKRQRQERRKERDLNPDLPDAAEPPEPVSAQNQGVEQRRAKRRTLSAYMLKNADLVCKWLRNYMHIFCIVDDAQIGFLDRISRERRNELVQEYVDVSTFIQNVRKIQSDPCNQEETEENDSENDRRADNIS